MSEFNNPESIAKPCSVNAYGRYLVCSPLPFFMIPFWNLKSSHSSAVSWNIKSGGNRITCSYSIVLMFSDWYFNEKS